MVKSTTNTENELVLTYLKNQGLEALEDYLRRGRLLVAVDDRELSRRWIAAFRMLVTAASARVHHDHRERLDLESEMTLRDSEPPYHCVTEEWCVLKDAVKALVYSQDARAILESAAREILEFENKRQKKASNWKLQAKTNRPNEAQP